MPRFLFLNAVATARTQGQDAFIIDLKDLVARYPESELSAMAKDMLAMMGQGMESQKGDLNSDLAELREQGSDTEDLTSEEQQFSTERNTTSIILLLLPEADETTLNKLLYEIALFNFSQFLIRDFDLQKLPVYGDGCALRISGFEKLDETDWYMGLVNNNDNLRLLFTEMQIVPVCISEDNAKLIPKPFSLDDYRIFMQKN